FVITDTNDVPKVMAFFDHEETEARRIVIFGGGNIGYFLAQQLEQEENDIRIKIIELHPERADYIAGKLLRTTVLQGSSLDIEILEEAGIGSAEAALAVTNDDEVNIFSALQARQLGCRRTMALVAKTQAYSSLIPMLGIDVVINPRETTVSSILRHIRRGNVRAAHSVCGGQAEIIETQVGKLSALIGRSIHDLDLPKGIRIAAIFRQGRTIIPDHTMAIAEQDRLVILSRTEDVRKVDRIFSARLDFF
ncbi:MAG: NAD-binding protein, partial [Rickettsiales bacterium]|nr:NAD-binding protein [Rickettsiales bacterium]